jgi:putative hydrolase of the HAD superfamily
MKAILFDLGGTLAQYFEPAETSAVLWQALAEAHAFLEERGMMPPPLAVVIQRVQSEGREAGDYRVKPLAERLERVFDLQIPSAGVLVDEMIRRFMRPIFALGRLFPDALPTLRLCRARGFKTAIVSNSPWGSPAKLWHEELDRLGLRTLVDVAVFCGDVGWRKPARQIFDYTLDQLRLDVADCLFVGDDPRWDLVGPQGVGMEALIIDRTEALAELGEGRLRTLYDLWPRIEA